MAYLKFYSNERKRWPWIWSQYFEDLEALEIFKRIKRSFPDGMKGVTMYFYGSHGSGCYKHYERKVRLSHRPSLGLIIHECAHAIEHTYKKRSKRNHTFRLFNVMEKIMKKCGWFEPTNEVNRKKRITKLFVQLRTLKKSLGELQNLRKKYLLRQDKKEREINRKISNIKKSLKLLQGGN
jgi:hypothetical protein